MSSNLFCYALLIFSLSILVNIHLSGIAFLISADIPGANTFATIATAAGVGIRFAQLNREVLSAARAWTLALFALLISSAGTITFVVGTQLLFEFALEVLSVV